MFAFSQFNTKAKYWVKGRKETILKLEKKSIWFHCASLGEFEQARPLIEKFKKEYSKFEIVLTFFSPSGYEIRKNYEFADYVYYLPLDTKNNAQQFITKINPALVIFIKYEFWYHFINELNNKKIPIFLVSGIFREKQIFFKFYGSLFRDILKNFTHLFVQDDKSLKLLKTIDILNVTQANDSRFDRVYYIYKQAKTFSKIEEFIDNKACIVLGSSWLIDEKLFSKIIYKFKNYKFIIAPHNLGKRRVKEIQELFPNNILYSKIDTCLQGKQVLIIDNMGMLSSIYKYGTIAYIGGGFGVSIHNILEAAVYSIPVVFGPKYSKMNEAFDLIANNGGFCVNNENELEALLSKFQNDDFLQECSKRAGDYVLQNIGGTDEVLNFLKNKGFI